MQELGEFDTAHSPCVCNNRNKIQRQQTQTMQMPKGVTPRSRCHENYFWWLNVVVVLFKKCHFVSLLYIYIFFFSVQFHKSLHTILLIYFLSYIIFGNGYRF